MVEPFSLRSGYKIQKLSQTFLDSLLYATTRGIQKYILLNTVVKKWVELFLLIQAPSV